MGLWSLIDSDTRRGQLPEPMESDLPSLLDPARVLVGLGAIAGLVAASEWRKFWRSVDTSGEVVKGPGKWELKDAAFWTMIALFLSSGGYLFGVFFGHI